MWNQVIYATIFFAVLASTSAWECKPSRVNCTSINTYKVCLQFGIVGQLVGSDVTCSPGKVCDDDQPTPCVTPTTQPTTIPTTTTSTTSTPSTTTTSTTTTISPTSTTQVTTTITPVTPECTEGVVSPAEKCNQYYKCVAVYWYYQEALLTCPANQEFNGTECVPSSSCTI